jgi:deoxyribonuclease-4
VDCINSIFSETPGIQSRLLLETTAGQGSSIGHTFEQIEHILKQIKRQDLIGVCMDTAHIFAAGYDIRDLTSYEDTMGTFDHTIGLSSLYLIHLNDSKKSLGSRVDRHEHIGRGAIGLPAFGRLMRDPRLAAIPKIIETPKNGSTDWDSTNLDILRRLHHHNAA